MERLVDHHHLRQRDRTFHRTIFSGFMNSDQTRHWFYAGAAWENIFGKGAFVSV
jgi:hypothetical protein